MKQMFFALSFFAVSLLTSGNVNAQGNGKEEIKNTINSYRDALNASDAGKVIALYTPDGVLIPNAAPTATGAEQVRGTYQYVFDNFTYNLEFSIGEILVSGDYAFVTSTSKGTVTIKASGQTLPDENRELFVLKKTKGSWKIARYIYNKSK